MTAIEKRTRRYPSDLTDAEWLAIELFLLGQARTGRKRRSNLWETLNAIRYLARSGVGWRMLPINFGPCQTVYWWFRCFVHRLLFQTVHDVTLMINRKLAGREASLIGGGIDSQTVNAPAATARGYDANKKIVGRKRHIAVDTDG
ncbi:MAG: IS5/IS1182 family transposase, partial [Oxalobacteraceae bacterium]